MVDVGSFFHFFALVLGLVGGWEGKGDRRTMYTFHSGSPALGEHVQHRLGQDLDVKAMSPAKPT